MMHNQNTLHLSDSQFAFVEQILSSATEEVSDTSLVEALTSKGIFEYPAQKLVAMRNKFQNIEV